MARQLLFTFGLSAIFACKPMGTDAARLMEIEGAEANCAASVGTDTSTSVQVEPSTEAAEKAGAPDCPPGVAQHQ